MPSGPSPEAIKRAIHAIWPDTDAVETAVAAFFSVDRAKHWPNFATLVTTDDFDGVSNLSRPGVFRLNIGVGPETFGRLVGTMTEPDFAALDVVLPHPEYAGQHWICILNPSDETFRDVVLPLLGEAHGRLVARLAGTRSEAGGE
ncbi:MAG TPA: DUF6194 family protein [Candidatus Limnocylindrales bacterium]